LVHTLIHTLIYIPPYPSYIHTLYYYYHTLYYRWVDSRTFEIVDVELRSSSSSVFAQDAHMLADLYLREEGDGGGDGDNRGGDGGGDGDNRGGEGDGILSAIDDLTEDIR
jgi:hypothetical protein